MSGIGDTIETDLVGEFVELCERSWDGKPIKIRASGRIRAVRAQPNSSGLILWIELVTAEDVARERGVHAQIGDVYFVATDTGSDERFMRLINKTGRSR